MNLTLEVLFVETDLANELLLGAAEGGWDSVLSDEGKIGVPGGVSSLWTQNGITINQIATSNISYLAYSKVSPKQLSKSKQYFIELTKFQKQNNDI